MGAHASGSGVRPGAAFGPGQQFSLRSDVSLCSKFSSGSGGGLDRAIDAARANEEGLDDDEDYEMDADVRCPSLQWPCGSTCNCPPSGRSMTEAVQVFIAHKEAC